MALMGTYRKIVVKPEKFSWKMLESNGNDEKALEVEFELPSSSYATICLREIIGEEIID